MKKEHIDFIKSLANIIQTQENDSQADPIFWTIMDYDYIPTTEDYSDEYVIYNKNENTSFRSAYELMSFIEEYVEPDDRTMEEIKGLDFEDLSDYVLNNLNGDDSFELIPVMKVEKIVRDRMFITRDDAINHFKTNRYHYGEDAHIYALTAYRSYHYDKLINILKEINIKE